MRFHTIRTLAPLALLGLSLSACRTMETTFDAPDAKLETAGAIDLEKNIPAPDPEQVAIGEVELRVTGDLFDDETIQRFGQNLREASGGLSKHTTEGKDPEYRIHIQQVNSAEEWEASGIGAAMGGLAGAGVGAATDDYAYRGGAIGGVIGAGAGAIAFGEQSDMWGITVAVYRRTTPGAVQERMDSLSRNDVNFSGSVSGDTYSLGSSNSSSGSNSELSFESDEYPAYFRAVLSVDSGTFHSSAKAKAAARRELADELPFVIFGGKEVDW